MKTSEGRDLIRLLNEGWPVKGGLRIRLIEYIKSSLPPDKRTARRRPLYLSQWLAIRDGIKEEMAKERAELGAKYNENASLNKIVPALRMSRQSLRVKVTKLLHKSRKARPPCASK